MFLRNIILISTLFILIAAGDKYSNPTCKRDSCKPCFDACPPFDKQKRALSSCTRKLTLASSRYASDAEIECKFAKCANIQYERLCQVTWTPFKSTTAKKHKLLDDKMRSMRARMKKLDGYAQRVEGALPAKQRLYNAKVEERLSKIGSLFHEALSVREQFLRQRELMKTADFRNAEITVASLRSEREELQQRSKFWKLKLYILRSAIKSSPLKLKKERDNLRAELKTARTNIALMHALNDAALSKDQKVALLIGLRLRIDGQIKDIKSLVANIRAQQVFIKEARREIARLLTKVREDVIRRKETISCGPFALSDLVTNNLLSSMSKAA